MRRCRIGLYVFAGTMGLAPAALAGAPEAMIGSLDPDHPIAALSVASSPAPITMAIVPGAETRLLALDEVNGATCVEISPGSWTVTTAAKFGTVTTGTIQATATTGACSGKTYTLDAIFYTQTKSTGVATDKLNATWRSPDGKGVFPVAFTLDLATIAFVSQDITKDSIVVNAQPSGLTGTLRIRAIGSTAKPLVVNQSISSGAAVQLAYHEATAPLPPSHYTQLSAVWTVNGVNIPATTNVKFTTLGLYENTTYNVVHEAQCTGKPGAVTLYTSACVAKAGSFKTDFQSQVRLNGIGVPQSVAGYTAPETVCATGATDFRSPFTVKNACGNANLNAGTIAVDMSAGAPLACGNHVFFVGQTPASGTIGSTKVVTDRCPGCNVHAAGTTGHVEDFSTSTACSNTTLPNYQAILLGE
jgi:hypothetical protein